MLLLYLIKLYNLLNYNIYLPEIVLSTILFLTSFKDNLINSFLVCIISDKVFSFLTLSAFLQFDSR